MNAPASVPLSGPVAPGQEVDLSVDLVSPASPGTYTGNWMLRNASGVLFGVEPGSGPFWVKILVVAPTETPTSVGLPPLASLLPLSPSTQQVSSASISLPAGGIGNGTATCPAGSVVASGGYHLSWPPAMVTYTQLPSGNGWQAFAKNNDSHPQSLTVLAICLSNTSGTTSLQLVSGTAPADGTGHLEAACPSGSVVTGGGFATNSNKSLWVDNSSADGNRWQVYARNLSGADQGFNAYAICLAGTSITTTQVLTANVSVPAHTFNQGEADCPSGQVLTGGGYALSEGLSVYSSGMDPSNTSMWDVVALNSGAGATSMNVYAICLSP